MKIICLGMSYRTAGVEFRERLAIPDGQLPATLDAVRRLPGIEECAILSTCNRVEVYAVTVDEEPAFEAIHDFLDARFSLGGQARLRFYELRYPDSVRHVFRVAAGLDSMVVGETEIFGQVKRAYAVAHRRRTAGRHLHRLFQETFRIVKQVRSRTRITQGATSVGSVAVDLANRIFGNLKSCRVMVIGAGETSRITAKSLCSRGVRGIIVSNRNHDRALELAREMDAEAIRFDDWDSRIGQIDIIISSTAAPHPILTRDMVAAVSGARRGRPLFIIDIAVPRDVDPAVNRIEGVYLYDIDALEALAEDGRRRRGDQVAACDGIIDEHMEAGAWERHLSAPRALHSGPGKMPAPEAMPGDEEWKPLTPA